MDKKSPIGVFDSGVGGLTILDKLIEDFPHEDFIYLGDNKNFPYGTKSSKQIEKFVIAISKYFESLDVKAIVIACNSASSNSACLKDIIKTKVIGVIEPTAKKALKVSNNKKIALLATELTVKNKQYDTFISKDVTLYPLACTTFVDLVENSDLSNKNEVFNVVDSHLSLLKNKEIDTIILGCTHFGLLKDEIAKSLVNTTLIECSTPVSEALKTYLNEHNLMNNQNEQGNILLLTTGNGQIMKEKIKWFNKKYQEIKEVNLQE